MNTLPWLIAFIGSLWLSIYSFGTLGEDALGYIGLGLVLFCLPQIIAAVWEDWRMLKGKQDEEG